MNMPVCPNCRTPVNPPGLPYCAMCGYPLAGPTALPGEPSRPVFFPQEARVPFTNTIANAVENLVKKIQRPLLIAGGLVLAAFAVWFFFLRGQPAGGVSPFSVQGPDPACQPFTAGSSYEEANTNDLEGELRRDSVFLSGEEYTIRENSSLVVPDGVSLLIEPGARIRFGRGAQMIVRGELLACGKANRRIYFTADQKTGQAGHWYGIVFDGASPGSVLGHATFEYAGMRGQPVIYINDVELSLEDLVFDGNASYPVSVTPGSFPQLRPPFTVKSGPEGWEIRSGALEEDLTWDTDQPLVINGRLTIAENVTLTVAAGSRVKFMPDSALEVFGRVSAEGTANRHILITSANDVSADAANKTWSGIVFKGDTAQADMTYVEYRYEEVEPGSE